MNATDQSARGHADVLYDLLAEDADGLLARAMHDSTIAMLIVAPDGAIARANPAASEFFGTAVEDLPSHTWQDLTHPDDLATDLVQVDRLRDGSADSYRLTKRYVRADGGVRIGDLSVSAVRDSDGTLRYFVSQIVDVTREREATAALAESERRFHLMFDRSADLVLVIAPDLTIEWLSPSVDAVLGAPAHEYVRTPVLRYVHPDDRQAVESTVAAAHGRTAVRFRHRLRLADGGYRWFSTSIVAEAATDRDGTVLYASSRDIDDTVRAEADLTRSRAALRAILDSLPDPWVLLEPVRDDANEIVDFVYADANEAACAFNETTREALIGMRLLEFLPGHVDSGLFAAYANVVATGEPLNLDEYPFSDRLDPQRTRYFDNRGVAIDGNLSFTWRDVTDRYELRKLLADQAYQDTLTGLPNRAGLTERMDATFGQTPRTGTRLAVLYCDIDNFKGINDTHGHLVGDGVLRAVGQRMRACVRDQDTVARLGGDEFVALLEGVHSVADALSIANKMRELVAEPIAVDGTSLTASLSIGVALVEPGERPDTTLRHADSALYRAKAQGRDRAVVYSPDTVE